MNYTSEDILLISVPLTAKDRQTAQAFADEQQGEDKKKQVYRNSLAVLATHRYLTMLGIPSELESSDSWDTSARQTQDVADLYIPEIEDRVECRAVSPEDDRCYIPRSVWGRQGGYIVIELDLEGHQGIILGYIPEVSAEQRPLSYLRPLDIFFERVEQGTTPVLVETAPDPILIVNRLTDWMDELINTGWLNPRELPQSYITMVAGGSTEADASDSTSNRSSSLEEKVIKLYQADSRQSSIQSEILDRSPVKALVTLINQTQDDSIRWNAAELLREVAPEHPSAATLKAKDLGLSLSGQDVALLVGIMRKPDGNALVRARVYSIGEAGVLLPDVELSGLEVDGQVFDQARSRQRDDYIQILFTAYMGEEFMLRVSFDDASVTEHFVV